MGDHFCLKWNNHQENLTGIMTKLLDEQKFVDVSLVCEMKTFKAHQTVLSACSPYFEQVLEENTHPHPIIILRDVKEAEMVALLQYMYRGEVSVRDDELPGFLHTARALRVRGLSDNKKEIITTQGKEETSQNSYVAQNEKASPPKRPKTLVKTIDDELIERHLSDCQPQTPISTVCKGSPKPSATSVAQIISHSDNSNEIRYSDTSTSSNIIKQEVEIIPPANDEQTIMPHHLGNIEAKNDHYHKIGDWKFEYGHNMEDRNYQTQKANTIAFNEFQDSSTVSRIRRTSLNTSLTESEGTEVFDGTKQWQIKYAFEKVEGNGFKCKICGQIKKHVRNHYLKHFPEHHECHLCRRTYTRKDNLNSHLKRDHFQKIKSSSDPYHRLKRLAKKFEDFQGLKCFTPDLYSQIKYSAPTSGNILHTHASSFQSQSSPISGPMDLSLRPSSVPIQNQFSPIYSIFPSFYNYFRS